MYAVADMQEDIPRRRNVDRSESNQNLPQEAVTSSTHDIVNLEDEACGIETIPLDVIREPSRQNCPTNSIRGTHRNAWK